MLKLIDSHMHLWDLSRHYYAWLQDDPLPNNPAGDMSPIAGKDYLPKDYLADTKAAEIIGAVHVECGLPLDNQLSETEWLNELADAEGLPSAIVCGAVLEDPYVERHLAEQAKRPRVRGVRQIINWHDDAAKTYTPADQLNSEAWRKGFAALANHGLSFDMQIYPGQMPAAAALAARNPGVPVILNHTGMPTDRDEAGLAAWREGMKLLAGVPSVSVKISGLAMVDRQWTAKSLEPFIRYTIDAFGPDRCMFGSNFPVESVHGTFAEHLEAFVAAIEPYTHDEQTALLEGTARRVYRL